MAMVSVAALFLPARPPTHASRSIRRDGLRSHILRAGDQHIYQGYHAKMARRTNHHEGARHCHAVPGSEPVRV